MAIPLTFNVLGDPLQWSEHASGILAVEDAYGNWEPVEIVSSLHESEEMICDDLELRSPDADALCPERYVLFLRGPSGKFRIVGEWVLKTEISVA